MTVGMTDWRKILWLAVLGCVIGCIFGLTGGVLSIPFFMAQYKPPLPEDAVILKDYEKHQDNYFYNQMVDNYQNTILFLGEAYKGLEQYDKAMLFLQEGLDYDLKQGHTLNIAKSKTAIGGLLRDMKKFEEAEKMLLEALQLKKDAGIPGNDRTMLSTYLEFVNLYNATKDGEKAEIYMSIIENTFGDFVGRNQHVQQFFKQIRDRLNS